MKVYHNFTSLKKVCGNYTSFISCTAFKNSPSINTLSVIPSPVKLHAPQYAVCDFYHILKHNEEENR